MFLLLVLLSSTDVGSSRATKFVILARQRGGSHFTVSLIDQDPSCVVAGELVSVQDAANNDFTTASLWTRKIDTFFEEASTDGAVGFILHQNQVCPFPETFEECVESFGTWASDRNIRIVHLVREAVLMTVSSDYVQSLDLDHVSSTTNITRASESHAFAASHAMPLTAKNLHRVRLAECEIERAHLILSSLYDYHYLRYESLIDTSLRHAALRDTFQFILPSNTTEQTVAREHAFENSQLLELHPPTCEDRIQNWTLTKHLLSRTTREACERLREIVERSRLLSGHRTM